MLSCLRVYHVCGGAVLDVDSMLGWCWLSFDGGGRKSGAAAMVVCFKIGMSGGDVGVFNGR